jgi:protein TonB
MNPISSFVFAAALFCATASPLAAADAGIEQSFDRNKGAIYALYGRALRESPGLKGKIVFEITIATSGEVSSCRIKSSELNHLDLETKLVERIKLFRFPPRQSPTTVVKPIDFFPAA